MEGQKNTHRWTVLVLTALAGWVGHAQAQDAAKPQPAPAVDVPAAAGQAGKIDAPADDAKVKTGFSVFRTEPWDFGMWAKVPPIRPLPRPGTFPMPPSGPGYYSLLDVVQGNYREGPPKIPYSAFIIMSTSFYDSDFRYLESPDNTQFDIFDPLHRIHLGDDLLFNTGGQFWYRGIQDINSRLSGKENDYDLYRVRPYLDMWYRDTFRIFVEGIYADTGGQSLAPAPTDIDRGDFQNLFLELKMFDLDGHPAYVRVGRQEIYLGSQRLVSALDWANTRRTFQGVRAYRTGEKFDVDLFWLRPVIPNPSGFSSWDDKQNFAGVWTTYRPEKGHFLDMYYLYLDNQNTTKKLGLQQFPEFVNTLGTRYAGNRESFLWDFELMFQAGKHLRQTDIAGASVAGLGYNFKQMPMNPTVWCYYDYASGTRNPTTASTSSTFNQLFPFGHPYLGFMDLVGRQNIHDPNVQFFLYPMKWVTVWGGYHHFWLASPTDALYNAGGTILRRDPTGRSGTNVGDELDIWLSFHLSAHSDFSVGWSRLYQGSFLKDTGSHQNPEQAYFLYSFRW
jgi:alginate export protein